MLSVREYRVNKTIKAGVLLGLALAAGTATAANVTYQPRFDMEVQTNDNFNLAPDSADAIDTLGYIADAEVLVDIANPRGSTMLRPRLRFQEYPDHDEDLERVESFFDLVSDYRWERSSFTLDANYSLRDVYNTETLGGEFDPDNPGSPDNPEGGTITTGETRELFVVRPSFQQRLTERTSLGLIAQYQIARYDADDDATTKTDYDYYGAGAYLQWALSPRSDVSAGAYASLYETTDNTEEADATGVQVTYAHRWSETDGIELTAFYEENDVTEFIPVRTEETTSDFGGSITAYRKLEVSTWRLVASRRFLPTGDAGKQTLDSIRLQYDRSLSQRLEFRGAARLESRSGLSTIGGAPERDYARADLTLRWFATPTWYLGGGYTYIWQDRETDPTSADNNRFFVNFGYRGLGR
jgi:hypothetical protein